MSELLFFCGPMNQLQLQLWIWLRLRLWLLAPHSLLQRVQIWLAQDDADEDDDEEQQQQDGVK